VLPDLQVGSLDAALDEVSGGIEHEEARRRSLDLPADQDRDVVRLEDEVSARLGTTVKIKSGGRKGSGQLVISYRSLDQLDVLLGKLK